MEPDILGVEFERLTIPLPDDHEGPVVATLVRRRCPVPSTVAVLYIHGFADYFFQTHLADQYVAHGFNFYAIDLRKHGRSLLPHQTANFTTDVRDYFTDIDAALRFIRTRDGNTRVLLNGHSTGGLTASLYAHSRRQRGELDGLFLNSPFFEFPGGRLADAQSALVARTVGRLTPQTTVVSGLPDHYGRSIAREYRGEWEYNFDWKPLTAFPLRAGWIRATWRAQRRVQAGLHINCPTLVMHSTRSCFPASWNDDLLRVDSVLDVDDIRRHSRALSNHLTLIAIDGGLHDLVLSAAPAREQVFGHLFTWTSTHLGNEG